MFQKQTISYEVGRYEKEGRFQIFIPKSFSPNQDGINDFFEIQTRSVLDFHIMVFDQWGNFVFDSNDPNLKWDGKIKGKSIRKAPYIYVVKIKTIDGQTLKYSGCLMIEL
jgi:gliding motility-associated-like protein